MDRRTFLTFLAVGTAGLGLGISPFLFSREEDIDGVMLEAKSDSNLLLPGNAKIPLVYNRQYNISAFGLEHLNPFDSCKYRKIQKHLTKLGLRQSADFIRPAELSREQLLTVHTPEYLDSLKNSEVLARIFEVAAAAVVPSALLDSAILHPMRLAGGGTILACRLALEKGVAINLGGGYHHADCDRGGGFCAYSDVPIALSILHAENKIQRTLIVDTDAHQGNGFANVMRKTGWGHVLDLFDESIYPYPKVKEDMSVPLPKGSVGDYYLTALERTLPQALASFKPDLIVYNAGSDVLDSDPLSSLRLSVMDMTLRDQFVVETALERKIPVAMVLAGGYGRESALSHAKSIQNLIEKFDAKI
jgi:histone deacetylase 11